MRACVRAFVRRGPAACMARPRSFVRARNLFPVFCCFADCRLLLEGRSSSSSSLYSSSSSMYRYSSSSSSSAAAAAAAAAAAWSLALLYQILGDACVSVRVSVSVLCFVCVRACVRACVRVCVLAHAHAHPQADFPQRRPAGPVSRTGPEPAQACGLGCVAAQLMSLIITTPMYYYCIGLPAAVTVTGGGIH